MSAKKMLSHGVKLVFSSAGLVAFCLSADHLVFKWEDKWKGLTHGMVLRALADNAVHGVVGGWSWANALLMTGEELRWMRIVQVVVCVVMASAIDLDHFIEAKSLSFKDALSLERRPFAHNTTLILIGTVLLYLLTSILLPALHLHRPLVQDLAPMFLVATLSHHLRDADRRGIWMAPFPSTPPIPYKLYPFIIILLPALVFAPRMLPVVFRALVEMPRTVRTHRTAPTQNIV